MVLYSCFVAFYYILNRSEVGCINRQSFDRSWFMIICRNWICFWFEFQLQLIAMLVLYLFEENNKISHSCFIHMMNRTLRTEQKTKWKNDEVMSIKVFNINLMLTLANLLSLPNIYWCVKFDLNSDKILFQKNWTLLALEWLL